MTRFIINEGMPAMVPTFEIEADRYAEDGSFTKFYDTEGKEVRSLRTDTVFGITTG